MKLIPKLLLKIGLPYEKIEWLADIRQQYRWRRDKGILELSWLNWAKKEIWKYIKYIGILSGASVGIRLIPFLPPEMYDRIFEWFPKVGEWMLWLSYNLTKEMIFYILATYFVGEVIWAVFRFFYGLLFEKSGFERAETKARRKQYDFYTQEEIVEPLQRIEKKLKTKDKKVGEKT